MAKNFRKWVIETELVIHEIQQSTNKTPKSSLMFKSQHTVYGGLSETYGVRSLSSFLYLEW